MDQVGIDFEWHHGEQFHRGKGACITIRFAMAPLLLKTVKIDSLFHCNRLGIILEFVCNAQTRDGSSGHQFEWHRGAQFHQGNWASNTIRFAMIPLLLQTVKIDSLAVSLQSL